MIVASPVTLLSGCGLPSASIEPTGSPTAAQTAEASAPAAPTAVAVASLPPSQIPQPTAAPTQNPDPCGYRAYTGPWTIDPLLPSSAVEVSIAELDLRAGPCTDAARVETLKKGDVLIMSGPYGPFKANGYPWYKVQKAQVGVDGKLVPLPASPTGPGPEVVGGWIAANDGIAPYVTPVAPRCPTTVNLENVRGMLGAERLACLKEPIVLTGTFGCGGCGGSGGPIAKPYWLADLFEFDHFWVHWFEDEQPISLHLRPSGPPKPREGRIIRVTVHVDDAAAQRCSFYYGTNEPPFQEPERLAIAWCRERFVVDSYEILGKDPRYP